MDTCETSEDQSSHTNTRLMSHDQIQYGEGRRAMAISGDRTQQETEASVEEVARDDFRTDESMVSDAEVIACPSRPAEENMQVQPPQSDLLFNRFKIVQNWGEKHYMRFNLKGRRFSVRFNEPPPDMHGDVPALLEFITEAINELLNYIGRFVVETDKVGIRISHDGLLRGPGGISWRHFSEINAGDLAGLIYQLTQSADKFRIDQELAIEFDRVRLPAGRGYTLMRRDMRRNGFNIAKKQCIVEIKNSDKFCLPRALVVAEAHFNQKGTPIGGPLHKAYKALAYSRSEKSNKSQQKNAAMALVKTAKVEVPEVGCGIPEIQKFQEFYAGKCLAIMVFRLKVLGKGEEPMFNGRLYLESKNIGISGYLNIY